MVAQFSQDDDETDRERFPLQSIAPRSSPAIVLRVHADVAPALWQLRSQFARAVDDHRGLQLENVFPPLVQLIVQLIQLGARTFTWPLMSVPAFLEGLTEQEILERQAIVEVGFALSVDVSHALTVVQQLPVVREANAVPEDAPSRYPSDDLLGASDQDLTRQWYLYRMRVDRAWCFSSGDGVVIADVDYGFSTSHEDLGNLDLAKAFNAHDLSSVVDYGPSITHGTAVMGLAGASANGIGMVGVAPSASLWPIQANIGPGPQVPGNKWARGIDYVRATDSAGKRKVVLLETQTKGAGGCYEQTLDARVAIEQAIAHGVVVVTAAGNGNREVSLTDAGVPYPDSGSILVGATSFHRCHNPRACSSNYGTRIAVSAPGYGPADLTCMADPTIKYRQGFGGTSGAAPKVAGVCALMLSVNPRLTPWDVKHLLIETGSEVITCPNRPAGVFVNARKAVKRAMRPC